MHILKEIRARYHFRIVGYVIMPEHLHLLITESASAPPSKIIQIFKQRLSRRMRARKRSPKKQMPLRFPNDQNLLRRFWQRRYYDFNVYSRAKLLEKLHYMHANPVREKLVSWPWSSWSFYYRGEALMQIDPWDLPSPTSPRKPTDEEQPTLCKPKTAKGRPPQKALPV